MPSRYRHITPIFITWHLNSVQLAPSHTIYQFYISQMFINNWPLKFVHPRPLPTPPHHRPRPRDLAFDLHAPRDPDWHVTNISLSAGGHVTNTCLRRSHSNAADDSLALGTRRRWRIWKTNWKRNIYHVSILFHQKQIVYFLYDL